VLRPQEGEIGLFSLIGSIIGSGSEKKGIRAGTAAEVNAFNQGISTLNNQWNTTNSEFAPYRDLGASAVGSLGDLMGLNGNDKLQAAITGLQSGPLYQSLYKNGLEANLQNASATGGIRGGNEVRSLADFGANTLASVIQNQLAQYMAAAGLGEGAVNQSAGYGAQNAGNVAGLLGDIGQAKAGQHFAIGGINAGNWNNIGGFLDGAAKSATSGGGFSLGGLIKGLF